MKPRRRRMPAGRAARAWVAVAAVAVAAVAVSAAAATGQPAAPTPAPSAAVPAGGRARPAGGATRLRLSGWSAPACSCAGAVARHLRAAGPVLKRSGALVARYGERLWPPPPCPDEAMERIGRYCIDRYEAHLVVPQGDRWAIHPHDQRPPEGVRYEARTAAGVFPQGYISRVEAARACGNAGKRLCSWLEWRRACQGPNWRRFSYGYSARRGTCNSGKDHLLSKFFGDKTKGWSYEQFNDPRLNREPGFLARSGQYSDCRTPDRLYDMNGNLHEWVSTSVTDEFVEKMEAEDVERVDQPWAVGNGMFLGGFYSTHEQHGPGCYYTTIAHGPRYHDYSTGFRCCATARRTPAVPKR